MSNQKDRQFNSWEVTGSGNKHYYDENRREIGKGYGECMTKTGSAGFLEKVYVHANFESTFYDIHGREIAYSAPTPTPEQPSLRMFVDVNEEPIGYSDRDKTSNKTYYYDVNWKNIGESTVSYSRDFCDRNFKGTTPFLKIMDSVAKEMDKNTSSLVKAILSSNNELEATKTLNKLLPKFKRRPMTMNNDMNEFNTTPLMAAIKKGYLSTAELLIKNGADPDPEDYRNMTPLMLAVLENKKDFAKLLVKNGANVNKKELYSTTPLATATKAGNKDAVTLLLKLGADINFKDYSDRNALSYARENADKDMVHLLRENGARRCWLHELLGKGDELKGNRNEEKYLTRRMWTRVADSHSVFLGAIALVATSLTGLTDVLSATFKAVQNLFVANKQRQKPIISMENSSEHHFCNRSKNSFTKTMFGKSVSKSQDKELTANKSFERPYSPGKRSGGYNVETNQLKAKTPERITELVCQR